MEFVNKVANQVKAHKKVLTIPAILLFAMGAVLAANLVFFQHTSVDVHVSEALNQSVLSTSVASFPGETQVENYTITNDANVPLNVELSFQEDQNVNNVSYSTDLPKTVLMQPGSNTVSAVFTIANDSVVGDFNGTISFARTQ